MRKFLSVVFCSLLTLSFVDAQVINQFTWDGTSDERVAAIGPNAINSGAQALAMPAGNGTPQGMAPCPVGGFGCAFAGNMNLVLNNSGGIFDVPEIRLSIDFNRRGRNEGEAMIYSRRSTGGGSPNFEFGLNFNRLVARYAVDNGAGGFNQRDVACFGCIPGGLDAPPNDNNWHNMVFEYYQATGVMNYYVDGVLVRSFTEPVAGRALRWSTNTMVIGTNTDNFRNPETVFDNALIEIPTVLPVTYNYFEGERKGTRIRLEWETANETNTGFFRVTRAIYGGESFYELDTLKAAGNTHDPTTYQFWDPNPQPGYNYYRLELVDLDGTTSKSSVVQVYYEVIETGLLGVYPNPVGEGQNLNIKFRAESEKFFDVKLMDLQGKIHYSGRFDTDSDIVLASIPTQSLRSGLYIAMVTAGGKVWTKKILKD